MPKVLLKPFTIGDSETYLNWINTPNIMEGLDKVLPVTSQEHEEWYKELISTNTNVAFSICLPTQDRIGMVSLVDIHWRHSKAEVRIVIGDQRQLKKGYGKEALIEISDFAFNKLGLNKLYAYILDFNIPSIKAFEGAGFEKEAILKRDRLFRGNFRDVFIYSKWK